MQLFKERQGTLVCFWLLSLFFVVRGSNYENHRTVEVVGLGECGDCRQNNIKSSHAFSGLRVTVDCKSPHGHFRTRGVGALDEYGNFKVSLPQDMVEDGELKEDCYAQLHSASAEPCPSHGNSKIVTKSISDDNKHTLMPAAGKLRFSSALCTSEFFWHFFKHPNFPFPPKDKENPPLPPKNNYPKDPLPPVPVYKKPPTSTPSPVVKKPCPPKEKTPSTPSPVYKPPTPIYKPLPPPTPISEPPPTMPPYFKFFPPFPFKKPCPPLPKMQPPKYFSYQHPWFGSWPPSRS